MEIIVSKDSADACRGAAKFIAELVRKKRDCVLGLATGSTPLGLYTELISMHKNEGLDFSKVTTFNLDEYVGLDASHDQSYNFFMRENLFRHINIPADNVNIPDGMAKDIPAFCKAYEARIKACGGIDMQLLGIGSNGHIAFNEPGSPLDSRTREQALTPKTIADNARFFGGDISKVPTRAITMGVGTIMEARSIVMLAFGANKAQAVFDMAKGPVSESVPASVLQRHAFAKCFADADAASKL